MYSVSSARLGDFATPRLHEDGPRTWTSEYQRLYYLTEPCRRCTIHNRPTCRFSADDGA